MPNDASKTSRRQSGLIPGESRNVGALISYQSGSVVSRTIVDRRSGTVTLFAFDRGEGLSEHTASYDALVHILEGEARVTVSGVSSDLKEDDVMILPSGKPHSVRAIKRFKMILTMIRESTARDDS